MKNLIFKYRGWLIAFFMAVALSVIISPPQIREISKSRLQKFIEDREVAGIAIVENKVGVRGRYTAEITLTPAALRKYEQLRAGIPSSVEGSHFVSTIGDSWEEVDQWKAGLTDRR